MTDFIVNNYIIIIVIAAFLIFALIGYAVDSTKNKKDKESDLLTKPNDEVDVNMIVEDPSFPEDVVASPASEDNSNEDVINMNTDN